MSMLKPALDIARKPQVRLCSRYRHLDASRKKPVVALTAVALKLARAVRALLSSSRLRTRHPGPLKSHRRGKTPPLHGDAHAATLAVPPETRHTPRTRPPKPFPALAFTAGRSTQAP
jgi:hypothetical protein